MSETSDVNCLIASPLLNGIPDAFLISSMNVACPARVAKGNRGRTKRLYSSYFNNFGRLPYQTLPGVNYLTFVPFDCEG